MRGKEILASTIACMVLLLFDAVSKVRKVESCHCQSDRPHVYHPDAGSATCTAEGQCSSHATQAVLHTPATAQPAVLQAHASAIVPRCLADSASSGRHQDLLNWSRTWITKDTLEARIQEALDNPVPLFPGEEDLVDSGFALETEDDDDEPPEAAVRRVAARDDPEAADRDVMEEGSDAMGSNRPRTQHDLR